MKDQRISDAEWRIMNTVWSHPPLSPSEIVKTVSRESSWKQSTIYTMISRLVKKGMLENKDGRVYALIEKDKMVRYEAKSLIEKAGSSKLVLAHFIDSGALSTEDIAELKEMIEGREADGDE